MFADFLCTIPVILFAIVMLAPDYLDYRLKLIQSKINLKNAENDNLRLQQTLVEDDSEEED